MGNRFLTLNTIVRVRQIEVTRDSAHGPDESGVHTPAEARKIYGYGGRNGMAGLHLWLTGIRERWPDAKLITQGEAEAANGTTTPVYQAALNEFIADVRTRYDPNLPFFVSWLSSAQTGLGQDPDGDGIKNGIENFLGTDPSEFSQGLGAGAYNPTVGAFTFTHPKNATPADDLTAVYQWSTNLATFNADGATVEDTRVDFAQGPPAADHPPFSPPSGPANGSFNGLHR